MLVDTLLNVLLIAVPTLVIEAMATTAIRAVSKAYSIAVAPSSSLRNRNNNFIYAAFPLLSICFITSIISITKIRAESNQDVNNYY